MKNIFLVLTALLSLLVVGCGADVTKPENKPFLYYGAQAQVSGGSVFVGDFGYDYNVTKINSVKDESGKEVSYTEFKNSKGYILRLDNISASDYVYIDYEYQEPNRPIANGKTYYYTITSYDYNSFKNIEEYNEDAPYIITADDIDISVPDVENKDIRLTIVNSVRDKNNVLLTDSLGFSNGYVYTVKDNKIYLYFKNEKGEYEAPYSFDVGYEYTKERTDYSSTADIEGELDKSSSSYPQTTTVIDSALEYGKSYLVHYYDVNGDLIDDFYDMQGTRIEDESETIIIENPYDESASSYKIWIY